MILELRLLEAAAYAAVASGALAVLVGLHKAWLPQVKFAALWVLWLLLRPSFARSASWWVERHGARPVRHRARWAWLDLAGRTRRPRAAVVRRARRVAIAAAALVDELTLSARTVTA